MKKKITEKLKSKVNIFGKYVSVSMILSIVCILTLIVLTSTGIASYLSSYGTVTGTMTVISKCELYDDFSSEPLDTSKWFELALTMSEHHIEDDVYHVAQTSVCGGRKIVLLIMNRLLESGDSIEYDINYISGNNNRISTAMLVNKDITTININSIRGRITSHMNNYDSILIGYLNGVYKEGNNDYGVYHMKLTFSDEGMYSELTRPDGSIITHLWENYVAEEYVFGVVTFVGPNSLIDIDYDNFVICKD